MLRLQCFGVLRLPRSRFFQRPLESARRAAHGTSRDLFVRNLNRDTTQEELHRVSVAANRKHIYYFRMRELKTELGNVGSRKCATSKT